MLRTRHVKLRLFIENIELPIDGCTVNTSTRITATVTLLPTKESLDLKSGSNVVVAFKNPDSNPPVVDHTPSEFDHYNILFPQDRLGHLRGGSWWLGGVNHQEWLYPLCVYYMINYLQKDKSYKYQKKSNRG